MPTFLKSLEKIRPLYDWTYKIILLVCKLLLGHFAQIPQKVR